MRQDYGALSVAQDVANLPDGETAWACWSILARAARLRHPGLGPSEFLVGGMRLGEQHLEYLAYGLVAARGGKLREVADARVRLDLDGAVAALLLANDHPEDGRLADAVFADRPDALALPQAEGHVPQDVARAKLKDSIQWFQIR